MKASKNIKGKQILLSGLIALVLVAGYYRWTINQNDEALPVSVGRLDVEEDGTKSTFNNNADYFEKSKYDRDYARSEAIALLNQMSEENISEEDRKKNEEKISKNVEKSQTETAIESLILSKGFENCVAFVDDDGISVVVKAEKLDSKSANQIKDIILSQSDFKAHQIKISSKAN